MPDQPVVVAYGIDDCVCSFVEATLRCFSGHIAKPPAAVDRLVKGVRG